MRRILFAVVSLVMSVSLFAQKDVTKFMGIPVDGFKPEMIQKLKEKGFTPSDSDKDILEGEFNGTQVNVHIVTNNNKVYRIMLADVHRLSEIDIKIRFNNLCEQFKNNSRYMNSDDFTIPEDEDISYEMAVNNKRYEAVFYQKPELTDSIAMANEFKEILLQKYSEEELENTTEDVKKGIIKMMLSHTIDWMSMKSVWFMISEKFGKYRILMYYDNKYNEVNGEDL